MGHKDASIVVKKEARIVELNAEGYQFVGTLGLICDRHEESLGWRAEADIELPLIMTDGWGPTSPPVSDQAFLHGVGGIGFGEAIIGMADDIPVHQVAGVADRDSWRIRKGRARHVEVPTDPDDIRIRIVGPDQRVGKSPVEIIGMNHIEKSDSTHRSDQNSLRRRVKIL